MRRCSPMCGLITYVNLWKACRFSVLCGHFSCLVADVDWLQAVLERVRVWWHWHAPSAIQHGVAARDCPGKQVRLGCVLSLTVNLFFLIQNNLKIFDISVSAPQQWRPVWGGILQQRTGGSLWTLLLVTSSHLSIIMLYQRQLFSLWLAELHSEVHVGMKCYGINKWKNFSFLKYYFKWNFLKCTCLTNSTPFSGEQRTVFHFFAGLWPTMPRRSGCCWKKTQMKRISGRWSGSSSTLKASLVKLPFIW